MHLANLGKKKKKMEKKCKLPHNLDSTSSF